jgi:Holliday junction resolvase
MSLRDLAKPERKKPKPKKKFRKLTRKQVRAIKKRGYDAEREIVNMLRDVGYDALRVPVSAPSSEPLPDVFAIKDDSILAIEVKSMERYAYYKRDQISKLEEFLEIHRIYPRRYAVLAGKFKYKGWWFKIAEELGDYTIKVDDGMTWEEFLRNIS